MQNDIVIEILEELKSWRRVAERLEAQNQRLREGIKGAIAELKYDTTNGMMVANELRALLEEGE